MACTCVSKGIYARKAQDMNFLDDDTVSLTLDTVCMCLPCADCMLDSCIEPSLS